MSIGIIEEENKQQQKTFELVSERSAICCFADNWATVILNMDFDKDKISGEVKNGLAEMGLIL